MNVVSIAGQVAAQMGDGWAATNGHWANREDAFLVNKDVTGRIHVALRDGRLRISGSLPEGWRDYAPSSWETDAPRDKPISVAPDKAPGKIAADITRRYLPVWKAYTEHAAKRKLASERHHDAVAASAEHYTRDVPGATFKAEDGEIRFRDVKGVSYGSARVHGDGGVRLDVTLDSEGATAFFRALRQLNKD